MTSRPAPADRSGRRGAAPRREHRPARRWWSHPALGAGLLALLFFLPTIRYGWVRDDHQMIAENQFLRHPRYLLQLLLTDFWSSPGGQSGLWRPVITLSYWIDGRISGWQPGWFHAVNALSHAAATALFALLLVEIGAGAAVAWFASLWFAVMPVHVESVAWISGRTDVWCAMFCFAALWMHERGARGTSWAWRSGAALAFLAGLLSKEGAAPVLAVFAALAWARLADSPKRWAQFAVETAPYLVITAVWAYVHQGIAPADLTPAAAWRHSTPMERVWTSVATLPSYLALLLPGHPQGPDWLIAPARSPLDPRVILGVLLHLVAIVFVIREWGKKSRLSAAMLLLWLPLALIGGLTLTRGVLLYGGRHLYMGSAGATWLVCVAGVRLWRRGMSPSSLPRWTPAAIYAAILAVSLFQTGVAMSGWWTDETMYRAMIRTQPDNASGYLGLALVSIGHRRDNLALEALSRATELDSTRYEIATYHAAIASRTGQWPQVVAWGRLARARGATEADPALMEVNALQAMDSLEAAHALLDTLMATHKSDPDVAAAYGKQMLAEKKPARAIKPLQYAVGWSPDDATLAILLGDAYARVKNYEDARRELQRATGLEPGNIEAWLRLASVCHLQGDFTARDQALANATSLPGADTTRIQQMWQKMAGLGEPGPIDK